MHISSRWLLALGLTIVALAAATWLIVSVGEMHDRLERYSPTLAVVFVAVALVVMAVSAMAAARLFWKLGRPERPLSARAPSDVVQAAELQAQGAEAVIRQVQEPAARQRLEQELAAIRADRHQRQFHVVVFGAGSAGKTSLINAMMGQAVGPTEAVMGTTRHGQAHTHTIAGVDGTLLLTDTPGLFEVGAGGSEREREARDLAARADLVLFVVDHDLTRAEYEPLVALVKQAKRAIVVLNKIDRFAPDDRAAIHAKLGERLRGLVPAADIVAVAADPRPVPVRVRNEDGTVQTIIEAEPPDLSALETRIAAILRREGDALRAGNLLLRSHLLSQNAQDQLGRERRRRALGVVEKFQWIAAGTAFANPLPAVEFMAASAVQFQMISELAAVYGVEISTSHVRTIGGQMIQMLLKLGLVEASSSLIAGLFKSTVVGFAAGGAIQAVSIAYLTRIAGLTFAEYFERGQTWGDGGMQAALVRQFDLNSRADFLQQFIRAGCEKLKLKVVGEFQKL